VYDRSFEEEILHNDTPGKRQRSGRRGDGPGDLRRWGDDPPIAANDDDDDDDDDASAFVKPRPLLRSPDAAKSRELMIGSFSFWRHEYCLWWS
jgi:hypothetical protein